MNFESEKPGIVKSIKQRDLLNTWLRLYAREQALPRLEEFQPSRLSDELPDMLFCTVDHTLTPPQVTIQNDAVRISNAYGTTGKGKHLEDYVGPRNMPVVMPVYYQCIQRALPVYTVSDIDDIYGRIVAYERLLLPFSEDQVPNGLIPESQRVTHVIASIKTISEDGGFEMKNLMRGNDASPTVKLCTVIDRDLFHRAPGRIPSGDVIEFV